MRNAGAERGSLTNQSNLAAERDAQAALIAFLSNPASYPGAVAVKRIETHAAVVFLAGDYAYKLKRAIKLPYLDFSTLEKRRAILEREMEINSRATPELYISIMPVTYRAGGPGFELGGAGETADWLLVMRRFRQSALLNAMTKEGHLSRELVEDLANTVEHFHRHAPVAETAGFADSLKNIAGTLETALCGPVAQARGLSLRPYIHQLRLTLRAQSGLIREREREGFVRHCHGDLHLKNIVLWEGKPRLFDALEFDDRLATIDVLYDLGFLIMDLWLRGLWHEANAILNHYLASSSIREIDGLALLPLYLSFRSAIRAMTGIHALGICGQDCHARLIMETEAYARFAADILQKQRPRLVAIGGLSGVGKSSVARDAAATIGAPPGALHIRTDIERKIMHGVALTHRLPHETYTPESRDEVYRRVFRKAEVALNAGCSVIVDAVFPEAGLRNQLRNIGEAAGADFCGIWLTADESFLKERIEARGADASDADVAVVERQLKTVEPPNNWLVIDASGGKDATIAAIAKELAARP
jgi:aminoglycoside phosphotransferase family enzyme/predicted kinase